MLVTKTAFKYLSSNENLLVDTFAYIYLIILTDILGRL